MKKKIIDLGIPATAKQRIVIIGGGFGGLTLTQKLSSEKFQTVLLDEHNYHSFLPLLYQVSIGGLEPDSIAYPLRKSLRRKDTFFRMERISRICPDENLVETLSGDLKYDYLIVATGSKPNFYGNESIAKNSLTLKSIPEALNLRSWLFQNLEHASLENDLHRFSVVIVGGGPTGVEIAGAIADIRNHALPKDYPELKFQDSKIYLIESSGKLLGMMSKTASEYSEKYLRQMKVEVMMNQSVKDFSGTTVSLSTGQLIETNILIWTAGVLGNPVDGLDPKTLLKNLRYRVDNYNRISGHENIFAIGDVAAMASENEKGHPMLAPVAIQQAKNLADNLNRNTGHWNKFHYLNKGVLATVGRNKALADIGSFHLHGFFAWLIWVFVHLMTLVGFRNRIIVFMNWLFNYFSFGSTIRLIIRPFRKEK
jgi:NADH dehydrogenase